jgi:magnesium transporter
MAMEEIRSKHLRWINITGVNDLNAPEIKYLKRNFGFHPLNLKDCIIRGQRPKIDEHRNHLFLVFLFPFYNRKTREIQSAEIDFFIARDYIISVHDNQLQEIVRFFNHLKKTKNSEEREEFLANNSMIILYMILNRFLAHCLPILDHLSIGIHEIEKLIFGGKEKVLVKEILITRRNIVNFRKTMAAHKNVLKKLKVANQTLKIFDPEKGDVYFNNLIEQTKEIWDSLDSSKESIEALRDTNESLISFRLNEIMKTFTIISVVIFILTLLATLFGMGVTGTPLAHIPLGFWWIVLVEIIMAFLIITFFKRRRWLE